MSKLNKCCAIDCKNDAFDCRFIDQERFYLCEKHLTKSYLNEYEIIAPPKIDKGDKYIKAIISRDGKSECRVDVYSVLDAFELNSSALDHSIKKILCAGNRGSKGWSKDLKEAINSIERALIRGEK